MMNSEFFNKFVNRSTARRALLTVLILALALFQTCAPAFAEGSKITYSGYKWTRIKSFNDLNSIEFQADDRSPKYKLLDTSKTGEVPSLDDGYWFRILVVYGSGDGYFMSGANTCNDGEDYAGSTIYATYGIDVNADSFVTRSGLYTPFIHYSGWDGDNNCGTFYFKFSNSKDDGPGSDTIGFNASWYGIKEAAAVKGRFKVTNFNNPSTSKASCACSASIYLKTCMQFDGQRVRFFYNVPGAVDRSWHIPDNNGRITAAKYSGGTFKIFIGIPQPINAIMESYSIPSGYCQYYSNCSIVEGVTISVSKGASAVIEGRCFNNGRIIVDGGTLVVRGMIDTDINVQQKENINPGTIEVRNGGVLYIEESGVLVTRDYNAVLSFTGGSSLVVDGGLSCYGKMTFDRSSARIKGGSAFLAGFKANDVVDTFAFGREYIAKNTGAFMSSLGRAVLGYPNETGDCLVMSNGSSLYCDGLFFCKDSSRIKVDGTSYLDGKISTNIEAPIGSMMGMW